MLQELSNNQVEQALAYLVNPVAEPLPEPLRNLDARRGHATALAQRVIIAGTQGDMAAADAGLEKVYALLAELNSRK